MATLEKIRNRAGLLIGVIGVALLAFVIGDGLRSGSFILRDNQQTVLEIDGEKIKIDEFQRKLTALQEQNPQMSDEQRAAMNNQLAQEFIENYAINKMAKDLGLRVTAEEFLALIYGEGVAPSPMAQQFFSQFGINSADKTAVSQFLDQISPDQIKALPAEHQGMMASVAEQWASVSEMILRNRLAEKFSALMTRSFAYNHLDEKYIAPETSRTVAVVRASSTQLPDAEVKLTDADIRNYYDTHKERFRSTVAQANISYIAMQVRPSAKDFQDAAAKMQKARQELLTSSEVSTIVHSYDEGQAPEFYLSLSELEEALLGTSAVDFLKGAAVGAVNEPQLENDRYTLVKLVGKKSAPEHVQIGIIVLDTANYAKADSILQALNSGASFASMVAAYSADPKTKATKGTVVLSNPQTGMPDSLFTEMAARQFGLDTLYKAPIGRSVLVEQGGARVIAKAFNPSAAVDKYKIAYVGVHADFSEETYNEKYSAINTILAENKTFASMVEAARKQGIAVNENTLLSTFSTQLPTVPASHEVVSWSFRSDKGATSEKIVRCGNDYLVIAHLNNKYEAGIVPFEEIKDRVKDLAMVDKRGDQWAENLKSKKISTLEAYASAMNASVDTLENISYQIRGAYHPAFNGYSMTTPIGKISAPFRAGTEVMVVQPISEGKAASDFTPMIANQQRRAFGQQLAQRAYRKMVTQLPVKDTRYNFY